MEEKVKIQIEQELKKYTSDSKVFKDYFTSMQEISSWLDTKKSS